MFQSGARIGQKLSCAREHRRITVQGDQFSVWSKLLQDVFAVTTAADRAVSYHESGSEIQKIQDLPNEHRAVYGRARIATGRRRIGHEFWELCIGESYETRIEAWAGFDQTSRFRPERIGPE
jgi:hypothetical protein